MWKRVPALHCLPFSAIKLVSGHVNVIVSLSVFYFYLGFSLPIICIIVIVSMAQTCTTFCYISPEHLQKNACQKMTQSSGCNEHITTHHNAPVLFKLTLRESSAGR